MSYRKSVLRHAAGLVGLLLMTAGVTPALAKEDAGFDVDPFIITSGDPADPKYANAGQNLRNGVGSIFIEFWGIEQGGFICTASAISPTEILTAAHCVTEEGDSVRRIRFVLSAGLTAPIIVDAESFAVHPFWPAFEPLFGPIAPGDVAILKLNEAMPLPDWIETYDIYRGTDEFGQETRHYGHGRSGKGNKGATGGADFFYARTGLNEYEQVVEPLLGLPPGFPLEGLFDSLVHDFDSGGRKHNAMEWWFTSQFACHPENPNNPPQANDGQCTTFKDGSYPDFKGFGKFEIGIAPGDSGGPGFIDGKIAGIHSFGFTSGCGGVTNIADFNCVLDSSYGEMAGDTRVSTYASWIDGVQAGNMDDVRQIPEDPITVPEETEAVAGSVEDNFFLNNVKVRHLRARVGN